MASVLKWFVTLPFIVLILVFALANQDETGLVYSPFHPPLSLPLYGAVFIFLTIGFVFGALATWFGTGPVRRERSALKKKVKALEKERHEGTQHHGITDTQNLLRD